ncbi:MAG: hypothetical protein JXR46_06160 [Calditrichaceae bacterium]|nr:hypothetical protein [Calditrichaceae bacterium]MBN2708610.1 hypothetical protein [Calditrichaceae bacterium]RQV95461.1 MAG: hypothetical protein EH224_07525 [Calditrichota bacterium]
MKIKIIGTESIGVRGLSCSVELKNRKIFIDPGIALGWSRYGFLPHPFQVAVGSEIRKTIVEELQTATDVIISHFDGDHCPLSDPNPYQLGISQIKDSLAKCRIWAKGLNNSPQTQQQRRKELTEILGKEIQNAEGLKAGPFEFSLPVPHGAKATKENMVMMSRIEENGMVFVHASDIQLSEEDTIDQILEWKPDIVLVSGPPLYRYTSASFQRLLEIAWENALKLSEKVNTLIIDHHLLRSEEGIKWLEKLKLHAKNTVCSAADFMGKQPIFLEAWRKELYEWLPVPENWHEDYEQGKTDFEQYRIRGWELLINNKKIKPCKWYDVCPIKAYTDAGKLERYWVENYCLVNNINCIRYQKEEKGEYHPDNMLPNGEIRESLQINF